MDSFEQNDSAWFREFKVSAANLLTEDYIHKAAVIIGLNEGEIERTISKPSKHLHFLQLLQARGHISSTTIDSLTDALQGAELSGVAKEIRDRFELCKRKYLPKGVSSAHALPEQKKAGEATHEADKGKSKIDLYNDILHRLGIQKGSKITLADSLIIKQNVPGNEEKPIDSLLSKLACLDHRIDRIPIIQTILRAESWENNVNTVCCDLDTGQNAADCTDSLENIGDCDETDNWVSDDEYDATENKRSNAISYRDLVYVFVCSLDAFLLQDILLKMSACQMAVPLLLPNHINGEISLLLWGLRKVSKSWYDHFSMKIKTENVVSFPFLTVSVIRLGEITQSKSKILNKLLSDSRGTAEHPHFLTFDQDSVKPICSKGVLETFWYLPNEEQGENGLQTPMCMLNLRGDAIQHQSQAKFAFKCSFAVIVFIKSESEKVFTNYITNIKSLCEVILVKCTSKDEKRPPKYLKHNLTKVYANGQTPSNTSAAIAQVLIKLLNKGAKLKRTCLDNLFDICKELQIQVDERNPACEKAQSAAKKVIDMTLQNFPNLSKTQLFPAQNIWKSFQDKTPDTKSLVFDTEEQLAKQRTNLRKMSREQLNEGVAPGILIFYYSLSCAETERQYFLEWMHLFLDDVAGMTLTPLLHKLKETKTTKRNISSNNTDDITTLVNQETKLSDEKKAIISQIDTQNLGIEHFFRELTQLSNSYFHLNDKELHHAIQFNTFPKLAAEVLLSGHPIELLDGDTNSIALQFLHELFKALRAIIGKNPRVFVISILGVQSSGKSTLLNAMFGLRFPVNAGRCTRGAFLQLLPLHTPLAKQLGCDYIAVIDSEGLMAPEKLIVSNPVRDNELATFAICISDLTLINIGGQVVGEDMTNILQIAAHAFIRMKAVDLDSNCRIIQQFVADITANSNNEAAMQSIVLQLDEAIQEAAKLEGKFHLYRKFTDVFKLENMYDDSKNLQYVPSLWRGFMEVPNYQYGVVVQSLKSAILRGIEKRDCSNISDLDTRIADVWYAISKENFVFSFQDTKEATLYERFMTLYRTWLVPIRSQILEKRLVARNKIKHAKRDKTFSIQTESNTEIDKILQVNCEELRKKIKQELRTEEYKHIKKHEKNFLADLEMFQSSTKNDAIKDTLKVTEVLRIVQEKTEIVERIYQELCSEAADVAKKLRVYISEHIANPSLKSRDSEILIDEEFKSKWDAWTNALKAEYPLRDTKTIECDLREVMMDAIAKQAQKTSLNFKDLIRKPLKSFSQPRLTSSLQYETVLTSASSNPDKRFGEIIDDLKHKAADYIHFKQNIDEILKSVELFLTESKIKLGKINIYLYVCALLVSKTHEGLCNAEVDLLLKRAHNHQSTTDLDHKEVIEQCLLQNIRSLLEISPEDVGVITRGNNTSSVQADESEASNGIPQMFKALVLNIKKAFVDSEKWLVDLEEKFNAELDKLQQRYKDQFCANKSIKEYAEKVIKLSKSHKAAKRPEAIRLGILNGVNRFHQYHTKYFIKKVNELNYHPIHDEAENLYSLHEIMQQVLLKVKFTTYDINEGDFKKALTADNIERIIYLPPSTKLLQLLDLEFMKMLPFKTMTAEDLSLIYNTVNETKLKLLSYIHDIAPFDQTIFAETIVDLRKKLENHAHKNEVTAAAIMHICSWIIPISAVEVYHYEESQNVFNLIEKEKEHIYNYFKSLCSDHEDKIIAQQFFKQILEPTLPDTIIVKVMARLLDKLSITYPEFIKKRFFIGKVLETLVDDYLGLTDFLQNFSVFGKNWTLHRIAELCSDQEKNVLTELASKSVELIIDELSTSVDECQEHFGTNDDEKLSEWLHLFCSIIERKTDIICKTSNIDKLLITCSVQNFKIFSKECKETFKGIKLLVSKLDIPKDCDIEKTKQWFLKVAPGFHNEVFENVEGCGKQCPFCGAACDDTLKKHSKHSALLHYPQGINGWRNKFSKKLFPLICSSAVESNRTYVTKHGNPYSRLYKDYGEDYEDWYIRGIRDNSPLPFCQFIFARYNDKLAERHKAEPADIPCEWQGIDKKQALDSLKGGYSDK